MIGAFGINAYKVQVGSALIASAAVQPPATKATFGVDTAKWKLFVDYHVPSKVSHLNYSKIAQRPE